ncbi:MAG TPA: hypothetical protein VGU22_14825 [Methylomirabilota bacterium]|jgi:hypothetical protein|nr:hypothetical protein [Methylomirabilota bacterium]
MRLITAHRILILAGIAFFVLYAVLQARQYLTTGSVVALVQAIVSLAVAAGFRVYFRSLARWGDKR